MSVLRDYLRLVRLPNLFTAAADVMAGYWLISERFDAPPSMLFAALASMCLYAGGVVLNDLVDCDEDRIDRPDRPLPCGRIALLSANRLYRGLLVTGLALSYLAAALSTAGESGFRGNRAPLVAVSLCLLILVYNLCLKYTLLAAVTMGVCRALNLILGMTLAGGLTSDLRLGAILAMFLYVASFSHFGRMETTGGSRSRLLSGGVGVGLSLLLLGIVVGERILQDTSTFVLWLALCIHLARVTRRAIVTPTVKAVQYAMKTFILALIIFDSVLAASAHGWPAGLLTLGLLAPTLLASRWVSPT